MQTIYRVRHNIGSARVHRLVIRSSERPRPFNSVAIATDIKNRGRAFDLLTELESQYASLENTMDLRERASVEAWTKATKKYPAGVLIMIGRSRYMVSSRQALQDIIRFQSRTLLVPILKADNAPPQVLAVGVWTEIEFDLLNLINELEKVWVA